MSSRRYRPCGSPRQFFRTVRGHYGNFIQMRHKNANSDVATAVRTSVVLVMAWAIVLLTGAYAGLAAITARSWVFLILSGAATGASWICYFKALSLGEVSKVAAVDKSSAVLSVLFAIILFPDERVFGGSN